MERRRLLWGPLWGRLLGALSGGAYWGRLLRALNGGPHFSEHLHLNVLQSFNEKQEIL